MNQQAIKILKALNKLYSGTIKPKRKELPICELDPDKASFLIFHKLLEDTPCMIARFGANELSTLVNYIGTKNPNKSIFNYITNKSLPWWWNENHITGNMHLVAGFFPPTIEKAEQFCELMLEDLKEVDILGSWLAEEQNFVDKMHDTKVHLRLLEPFWGTAPWTSALKGKKILVIHPFADTILRQYEKRECLFQIKDTLPKFATLQVIKAVQTHGAATVEFADWFDALNFMKRQIDESDYDVCLIGAGAYGFSLAAHVKRMGKKAIHLGGALQLLFGIKGKRWEDPNYGVSKWGIPYGSYTELMNEYWTKPQDTEKPKSAEVVEGACYW